MLVGVDLLGSQRVPSITFWIAGGTLTPAAWRVCGRLSSTVSDPFWSKSLHDLADPEQDGLHGLDAALIAFWIAVFASARSRP